MNVDLNTALGANRLSAVDLKRPEDAATKQVNASKILAFSEPALTITTSTVSLTNGIDDVPESALRRDDDLGKLMTAAFDFQPPEMPNFV